MSVYTVRTEADTSNVDHQTRTRDWDAQTLELAFDAALRAHEDVVGIDRSVWASLVAVDGVLTGEPMLCEFHGFAHADHPELRRYMGCGL